MNKTRQTVIYLISDFVTAAIAWLLFNVFRFHELAQYDFNSLSDFLLSSTVVKGQTLIPLFWLTISFLSGYYNKPFSKSRFYDFLTTSVTVALGVILIFFIVVLNELPRSFQIFYYQFFALCMLQFVFMFTGRFIITTCKLNKFRRGVWQENALIIGTGNNAALLSNNLAARGYNVIGTIDPADITLQTTQKSADSLSLQLPTDKPVNTIYIAIDTGEEVQLIYRLYQYNIPIKVVATEKNNLLSKAKVKSIQDIPTIDVTDNNFSDMERNIKWLMDKLVSALALIILSPLFLFIALRVKRDSKGPVFFRQQRIGYHGKPFTICKFRTMYANLPDDGPLLTAPNDTRVTPFGKFLRKYRLDEIPQFWNVFTGDMSLVGPRPEQKYYIERIVIKAPYYYLLHNVRPGITSLGMVRYGYADTVDKMIERLNYDILYYENMSLILDCKILLYTIKTVFTGKGI
jgi:exopolysaccharide biosynthesis polyprenyl glycosylphosphotransferase